MPARCDVFLAHPTDDSEMTQNSAFDTYLVYLETLTAGDIAHLGDYVSPDVRFCDPFHDVQGVGEMAAIFSRLFSTVRGITFSVRESGGNGSCFFFRWILTGTLRHKKWTVEGVTLLEIRADGKVVSHREYWDAASQFYEKFPIIGPLLRILRARIASS